MKIYSFDPKKKKKILIGDMEETTLTMERDSRKHFMRVVDGYGMQAEAHAELTERGVTKVVINEVNTKLTWTSDLGDWRMFGKLMDYGNGKQWFLSKKYMKKGE